jgi:hypothetical protein
MEDLDLDELDQAVNKMMDNPRGKKSAKKHDAPLTVPARNALSAPEPMSSTATTAEPSEEPASRVASVPVSRPMPKVPPRTRMHPGAMDIIQPSTPKPAPSSGPGRTGIALQPTKPVVTPEPVALAHTAPVSSPPADEDVSEDVLASLSLTDESGTPSSITKPQVTTETQQKNDWPDPLDFHDLVAPKKEADQSANSMQNEPQETPPSLESDALLRGDDQQSAPASATPFVTTKVEKRPLGAYADAKPEPTPEPVAPVAPTAEQEKPAFVPDETTTKQDMAETAMHGGHHLFKPGQEPEHDMDDLRNMAIPPQYHTAHAEPTDAIHSVFDTKEYHAAPQPVHTARHSGGPGLVIAVVVLIVLIIAAAAVGYLMMTGTDLTHLW